MPHFVFYICAAMLFIAAAPLPFGYYTLLRIVICIATSIMAYRSHRIGSSTLPWVLGLIAILFNPFIKIYFPKEIWAIVDITAGVILLIASRKLARESSEKANQ